EVPLPEGSIDISFDTPDKTWGAAVIRPTVNLFLWDIRRNTSVGRTAMTELRDADGQVSRHQGPVTVDLRYLITVGATNSRDEHRLLGTVLRCVLRTPVLASHVADGIADQIGTVRMTLAADAHDMTDFWSALEGRIKPGLEVELTMALDVFAPVPAGPPVR